MTARLRELADLWKAGDFEERECAEQLLAILDAEGDGDGVAADNADVMVCKIGDYGKLDKRMWATVIYDDKKVAECYTNEDAELIGAALRAYSAHTNQARSGGVSDADVEDAVERVAKAMWETFPRGVPWSNEVTSANEWRTLARAALAAQPRAVPAERVVDGWVLVPREPTPEMLAAVAGMEISVRVAEDDTAEYPVPEDDCAEIYRAMLAAGTSPGESNSKPTDCSGDPSSCPDNEGRGCYCSDLRRVGESA